MPGRKNEIRMSCSTISTTFPRLMPSITSLLFQGQTSTGKLPEDPMKALTLAPLGDDSYFFPSKS
uniref:Uncharacterized protein n=1 Tax=Picea glauca TaxID=3330 RepID=A0A101LVE0_PICGL|nr:hypothetical protein ABT39_MTgene2207 [Picea glauca]QHR87796.1 hypothetical protein Q903MT_gene1808 [Picea sitchensis]